MTAITALTAQNTIGVSGVHTTPPEFIVEQVRQVATDIGVDAVKIGMLGTAETVQAVRRGARPARARHADRDRPGDGGRVRRRAARRSRPRRARRAADPARHRDHPQPPRGARARAATPTGTRRSSPSTLHRLGPQAVVVTGGHRDEVTDVFYDGATLETLERPAPPRRRRPRLAAARTRARSPPTSRSATTPLDAARQAREIASAAVENGLREIGHGAGPVDVFGLRHGPAVGAPDPERSTTHVA